MTLYSQLTWQEKEKKQEAKVAGLIGQHGRSAAKRAGEAKNELMNIRSYMEKDFDEPNTTPIPGKPHGELKEWSSDMKIDAPSQTIKGSDKIASSGPSLSQGLGKASNLLNSIVELEKAFGEGDIISMGSGHAYSPKQDYSMYIGQGMGYA